MLNYKQIWHGIKLIRWLNKFNLTDMEESPRSSFAWRSIMQAREGVLRGAGWRVSDGNNINIWQHHWLPSKRDGGILSP